MLQLSPVVVLITYIRELKRLFVALAVKLILMEKGCNGRIDIISHFERL